MRDKLEAIIDKAQQAVLDAGACGNAIAIDDARTAAVDAIMGLIEKDYRRVYGCHDVDEFYRDATEPVGPKPPQPLVIQADDGTTWEHVGYPPPVISDGDGGTHYADKTPERML